MTCLAKHASLENVKSCDRDRSMQSPSCGDGPEMGALEVMCTWIFSPVGVCGSLPAGIYTVEIT